jgi:hypothetical protein
MRRTRALVLFGVASFAGCGLFPDLADLADEGGAVFDVAPRDVAVGDVTYEATTMDASECDGHLFCDDFDNETLAFEKWDTNTTTGGTLSFSSNAISLPYSLEVMANAGPMGGGPALTKSFGVASHIHLELELTGTCSVLEADLVQFNLTPPPPGYASASLYFYQAPASGHIALGYVLEGGAPIADAADISAVPNLSVWRHYALDIDFRASTFSVTYTDDAGSTKNQVDIVPALPPSAYTLVLGVPGHSPLSSDCTANFDDVVLD